MKSRIMHSFYVTNFLDVDFYSDEISKIVKSRTDKILEVFKNDLLKDWEVHFVFIYTMQKAFLCIVRPQTGLSMQFKIAETWRKCSRLRYFAAVKNLSPFTINRLLAFVLPDQY